VRSGVHAEELPDGLVVEGGDACRRGGSSPTTTTASRWPSGCSPHSRVRIVQIDRPGGGGRLLSRLLGIARTAVFAVRDHLHPNISIRDAPGRDHHRHRRAGRLGKELHRPRRRRRARLPAPRLRRLLPDHHPRRAPRRHPAERVGDAFSRPPGGVRGRREPGRRPLRDVGVGRARGGCDPLARGERARLPHGRRPRRARVADGGAARCGGARRARGRRARHRERRLPRRRAEGLPGRRARRSARAAGSASRASPSRTSRRSARRPPASPTATCATPPAPSPLSCAPPTPSSSTPPGSPSTPRSAPSYASRSTPHGVDTSGHSRRYVSLLPRARGPLVCVPPTPVPEAVPFQH
jgi:hypothetical protein